VNQEEYTVSLKEELEINKSSTTEKGSATITLTIKDNSSGEEEDVTLTWVIPMVRAYYVCGCGYISYDSDEFLRSHMVAHALNGEANGYTINYEYVEDTDEETVQQSNELVDLE
jgi:hypothetical protein